MKPQFKKFPTGSKKRGVLFNVLKSELKAVYPPMSKENKAKFQEKSK